MHISKLEKMFNEEGWISRLYHPLGDYATALHNALPAKLKGLVELFFRRLVERGNPRYAKRTLKKMLLGHFILRLKIRKERLSISIRDACYHFKSHKYNGDRVVLKANWK